MSPSSPSPRARRLIELLPVLAALALHAVAHGRWMLCGPVMGGLVGAALLGRSVVPSSERLLVAGALGLGAGVALLGVSEPPTAPFPPTLFGPLCGVLVGLTALGGLGPDRQSAWSYAALLTALSLRVRALPGAGWVLGSVALGVLGVVLAEARPWRAGARAVVGLGVFLALVAGGMVGLSHALRLSEGMLMEALFRMTNREMPGVDFQSSVNLRTVERKGRGSEHAVMVLSGPAPARLRTRVFDAFDGRSWTVSPALAGERWTLPPDGASAGRPLSLTLLTPMGDALPAPAGTRAVRGVSADVHGGWVLGAEDGVGRTLELGVDAPDALPPEPAPDGRYTALPEAVAAELRPLAEALTRGARTPRERARALEAYFQDHFEYSLSVNLEGEGSPLAVMVRERRPAYCTYFASAMAALLRSVGLPARVVGGFAPEEHHALTGTTLVRERDAHAWVEVYVADEGRFVAYDPTPWRSRDEAMGMPAGDKGPAGQLLGAAGALLRELWAGLRYQPLARARAMLGSPGVWGLVAALGVWRWRGGRGREARRARRGAMAGPDAKLSAVYARYLRTLQRGAGLVPRPAETDDELLARLRAARGEAAARAAEDFLASYREARYGGAPLAPEHGLALVERLGTALAGPAGKGAS